MTTLEINFKEEYNQRLEKAIKDLYELMGWSDTVEPVIGVVRQSIAINQRYLDCDNVKDYSSRVKEILITSFTGAEEGVTSDQRDYVRVRDYVRDISNVIIYLIKLKKDL